MSDRPVYIIEVEPTPDSTVPDIIGLRRLLKALLRSYGMRARSVTQSDGTKPPTDSAPTEAGRGSVRVRTGEGVG